jgi:osmotically-inducible protein OsmY
MKTLRWLIVFVASAVVVYLLLSTPGARADRTTHIVMDPAVAENARVLLDEGRRVFKDAVVKGATIAADKTKEGLSKSGEVITNEWITTRVHARFVDEDLLKGSDISVDTDDRAW